MSMESSAQHILEQLRYRGYVILEDLVPTGIIKKVRAELEPWFEKTPRSQGDFYGWKTTRFGSLLAKAPSCHKLVANKIILSIMDSVLGPNCDWFQLNVSQAVRIHSDELAQPVHRDEDMWPGSKKFEYLVNVIWALDDFTAENGATRIWPRNKFVAHNTTLKENDATVAAMPAGSAAIFLGSAAHCGGANISYSNRTGIVFGYCLGWLKQLENQFLSYPPKVARTFSTEIQDLIGYRIHKPNLGGYENRSPAVLFDENCPEALAAIDSLTPEIETLLKQRRENVA